MTEKTLIENKIVSTDPPYKVALHFCCLFLIRSVTNAKEARRKQDTLIVLVSCISKYSTYITVIMK